MIDLRLGDCLEVLRELPDASVDAVVTDPPYGIGFMGREWDSFSPAAVSARAESIRRKGTARSSETWPGKLGEGSQGGGVAIVYDDKSAAGNRRFQAWCEAWASECLRVLKPGGHLLAFGGTRTYHRLACGLEDAGFEIRDCLAWMFGSGFPKSLDVSKAIGARAGAERERQEPQRRASQSSSIHASGFGVDGWAPTVREAATPEAEQWQGWGTALKPAFEPIVLARKPLTGTVAANVLEHGTGALNIDGCRIGVEDDAYARNHSGDRGHDGTRSIGERGATDLRPGGGSASDVGRWPANVVLDETAAAMLDEQTGELTSGANPTRRGSDKFRDAYGDFKGQEECVAARGADSGGASRFFYCAKVSRAERNAGLDGFEEQEARTLAGGHIVSEGRTADKRGGPRANVHPTVKPIDLMRWLIRLTTPPGGTVLDPFLGSGSTGCAAALEHRPFIGIEREPDYMRIAQARIDFWAEHGEAGLDIVRARDAAEKTREKIADAGQLDLFAGDAA